MGTGGDVTSAGACTGRSNDLSDGCSTATAGAAAEGEGTSWNASIVVGGMAGRSSGTADTEALRGAMAWSEPLAGALASDFEVLGNSAVTVGGCGGDGGRTTG
jgi:hypothetical protein